MKQKTSLEGLTQFIALLTGVLKMSLALIELLGKVVNYGSRPSQLRVRL